jgi:hypothetical protein
MRGGKKEPNLTNLQEHARAECELNVARLVERKDLQRAFANPRNAFRRQPLEEVPHFV